MKAPCCYCGNPNLAYKGLSKSGKRKYRPFCTSCVGRIKKFGKEVVYIVKDKCFICGFIPEHSCQMDIDHIDGNSNNNDFSNFQVLCANCHRLKTYISQDWKPNT